jgi:hypothetical protein
MSEALAAIPLARVTTASLGREEQQLWSMGEKVVDESEV